MASLETLSDAEIRSKLIDLGCDVGPVTPSTRKVYIKKLKSELEKNDGGDRTPEPSLERSLFENRRKSPARSPKSAKPQVHPLASSTLVEPVPAAWKNEKRQVPVREVTPPEKRVSSSTSPVVPPVADVVPPKAYVSSPMYNSPSYFSGASSFRSRLSEFDSDQPYASEFTRRLSANTSASRLGQSSSLRSPRLSSHYHDKYDNVKESDDEEEENSCTVDSSKFGTRSRGSGQQRGNGAMMTGVGSGWLGGRDASVYVLGFLALFFLIVAYAYIHMHREASVAPYTPDLMYPKCDGFNKDCIPEHEMKRASAVFRLLVAELNDMAARGGCTLQSPPTICMTEAANIINTKDPNLSAFELDRYAEYAGILALSNPSKNVLFSYKDGFKLKELAPSIFCSLLIHTVSLTYWFIRIGVCLLLALSVYGVFKWWSVRKSRHKEEVVMMLSQIMDLVSSSSSHEGPGFTVIAHVRDRLIPALDKSSKKKVWEEAVALLEADSRVRKEVQQVEGEDFLVWRWLAPPPNHKKKQWQGQAFETMVGSVNSLPESPTPCLKIRHMFDPSQEEGERWVTLVADAILEKCKDAVIYHIVVEKQSPEGCVYIKCASPRDAGIAYRALHGFWFDSKLVTVKYIREARYLERFPDSARAKYPLVPSSRRQN